MALPAARATSSTVVHGGKVGSARAQQLRQLGDVGGDAPSLVAGQTDSSPSMAGIALLMPVNRVGAVEYEIDENNGIKA
jgi:hypothetical protein